MTDHGPKQSSYELTIREVFEPVLEQFQEFDRDMSLKMIASIVGVDIFYEALMTEESQRRDVIKFYLREISNILTEDPDVAPQALVGQLISVHAGCLMHIISDGTPVTKIPKLHTDN